MLVNCSIEVNANETKRVVFTFDGRIFQTQVQVAVLTADILELTEHSKKHPKDFSTKRGLLAKVNRRRKLLTYIKRKSVSAYQEIIKRLGLRK